MQYGSHAGATLLPSAADLLLLDEAGVGVVQRLQPAFRILQLALHSITGHGVSRRHACMWAHTARCRGQLNIQLWQGP